MFRKSSRKVAACVASLCTLFAVAITPATALADSSQLIVTLGADLTDSEREEVLDFFNLTEDDLDSMEVIEVTNEDEREYLSDYLSDDVIGTETLSCSYIEPTSSGGINVETANLTYVTKNTISNALETAGVENANIVVTAPYDVSGTGALTGVFMAYEATGEDLDEDAEDAATEELVESAELEDEYGEDVTDVISDVKDEVGEDGDMSDDDILDLVEQKADENGVDLSDDAMQTIADIASRAQSVGFGTESTGFWGSIKNFFTSIGTTISGWVSNIVDAVTGDDDDADEEDADDEDTDDDEDTTDEDTDEDSEDEEEHSDEGILGSLNTDVFDLDNPDSDSDSTDDTDTYSEGTDGTDGTDSGTTDDGTSSDDFGTTTDDGSGDTDGTDDGYGAGTN